MANRASVSIKKLKKKGGNKDIVFFLLAKTSKATFPGRLKCDVWEFKRNWCEKIKSSKRKKKEINAILFLLLKSDNTGFLNEQKHDIREFKKREKGKNTLFFLLLRYNKAIF